MGSVEIGKKLLYRSGVVIPNELGDPVRSVLGGGYGLDYIASEYESGTQPDVASAPNQASGTGLGDVSQSVEATRWHSLTDSGFAAWENSSSGSRRMSAGIISPAISAVADELTLFLVFRASGGLSASSHGLTRLSDSSGAKSFSIRLGVNEVRCAVTSTVLRGAFGFGNALTDTASPHIARLTVDANFITLAVDGVAAGTGSAPTGGIDFAVQQCEIGASDGNAAWIHYQTVLAVNPTASQIAAVEQLLADRYGVTLA